MLRNTAVALSVVLALALVGCKADDGDGVATAGGRGKASASPTADRLSDRERALKFAKCMRRNGVPDFPDPEVDDKGGIKMRLPEGAEKPDKKQVDAAMKKCKKYRPNGGQPPKADPETMEKFRRYAKCMRRNGVPNFPDPTDQGLRIDGNKLGMSPEDPRFKAAEKTCKKYLPKRPPGGGAGTDRSDG